MQEGNFRLKKERGDTNVSGALTKPLDEKRVTVDDDGSRIHTWSNLVGAASAVMIVFSTIKLCAVDVTFIPGEDVEYFSV